LVAEVERIIAARHRVLGHRRATLLHPAARRTPRPGSPRAPRSRSSSRRSRRVRGMNTEIPRRARPLKGARPPG